MIINGLDDTKVEISQVFQDIVMDSQLFKLPNLHHNYILNYVKLVRESMNL